MNNNFISGIIKDIEEIKQMTPYTIDNIEMYEFGKEIINKEMDFILPNFTSILNIDVNVKKLVFQTKANEYKVNFNNGGARIYPIIKNDLIMELIYLKNHGGNPIYIYNNYYDDEYKALYKNIMKYNTFQYIWDNI